VKLALNLLDRISEPHHSLTRLVPRWLPAGGGGGERLCYSAGTTPVFHRTGRSPGCVRAEKRKSHASSICLCACRPLGDRSNRSTSDRGGVATDRVRRIAAKHMGVGAHGHDRGQMTPTTSERVVAAWDGLVDVVIVRAITAHDSRDRF